MKKHDAIEDLHEQAWRLVDQELIEGLEPEERRRLEDHLAACEACAARFRSTKAALQALKTISIPIPPGLAVSTSLRVREEVAQLRHRHARNFALIAGCAVSWVAGVASAPLVWRLFEWFGTTLALPRIVWEFGFFCWWLVPAACAALVILWARTRAEYEEFSGRLETGP
jgi:ferric-dicitrate binding protein FerR (iron transport regulator)